MTFAFLAVLLFQDPAPQTQVPPAPVVTPAQQEKPRASREDRLEGRVAVDPAALEKPAAPAPGAPVDERLASWKMLNSCGLIVNEEPLTNLDLTRAVQRRMRERKRGTADPEVMFNEELMARTREMLEIQGGKDQGFPPEQVDRIVRDQMKRQGEDLGSVTELAAELKREDINSFERSEEFYAYVYKRLWEEAITGKSASPGGRISRDRYVRPGWAMYIQRVAARKQAGSRSVQLTQLVLPLDAPGSEERAKARLEDLRNRIENGEDMGELAEQFGGAAKGSHGLSEFLAIEGLRAEFPEVGAFMDTAQVGELSPVLDVHIDGKLVGYRLVRAEEFKTARVEPFDQPQGQRSWIEGQRRQLQEWRIEAGLMELLDSAYVWPPTAFKAPQPKP